MNNFHALIGASHNVFYIIKNGNSDSYISLIHFFPVIYYFDVFYFSATLEKFRHIF